MLGCWVRAHGGSVRMKSVVDAMVEETGEKLAALLKGLMNR